MNAPWNRGSNRSAGRCGDPVPPIVCEDDLEQRDRSRSQPRKNAALPQDALTSADWLKLIRLWAKDIDKATAQYFTWRPTVNQIEASLPLYSIVSHTVTAIHNKFASDGPQSSVQPGPQLGVLVGWLRLKAQLEGIDAQNRRKRLF